MILHCMKKIIWEERKNKEFWGKRDLERCGLIHASSPEYFWRVAPNFKSVKEDLVILCIDEKKLKSEVRYEDFDGYGRLYPHIYGLVNNDAVMAVYEFKKDKDGNYLKNDELAYIEDK